MKKRCRNQSTSFNCVDASHSAHDECGIDRTGRNAAPPHQEKRASVACVYIVFICTWCLYLKGGRVGNLVLSLFLVTQVSWNNKREPPFPSTERWMSNRSHGFRRISIPAVCSWVTHSPVGQRGIPCWNRFGVPMACCRSRCIFAENASHMLPTGFGQISAWDGVSRVKFWSERLRCPTKHFCWTEIC